MFGNLLGNAKKNRVLENLTKGQANNTTDEYANFMLEDPSIWADLFKRNSHNAHLYLEHFIQKNQLKDFLTKAYQMQIPLVKIIFEYYLEFSLTKNLNIEWGPIQARFDSSLDISYGSIYRCNRTQERIYQHGGAHFIYCKKFLAEEKAISEKMFAIVEKNILPEIEKSELLRQAFEKTEFARKDNNTEVSELFSQALPVPGFLRMILNLLTPQKIVKEISVGRNNLFQQYLDAFPRSRNALKAIVERIIKDRDAINRHIDPALFERLKKVSPSLYALYSGEPLNDQVTFGGLPIEEIRVCVNDKHEPFWPKDVLNDLRRNPSKLFGLLSQDKELFYKFFNVFLYAQVDPDDLTECQNFFKKIAAEENFDHVKLWTALCDFPELYRRNRHCPHYLHLIYTKHLTLDTLLEKNIAADFLIKLLEDNNSHMAEVLIKGTKNPSSTLRALLSLHAKNMLCIKDGYAKGWFLVQSASYIEGIDFSPLIQDGDNDFFRALVSDDILYFTKVYKNLTVDTRINLIPKLSKKLMQEIYNTAVFSNLVHDWVNSRQINYTFSNDLLSLLVENKNLELAQLVYQSNPGYFQSQEVLISNYMQFLESSVLEGKQVDPQFLQFKITCWLDSPVQFLTDVRVNPAVALKYINVMNGEQLHILIKNAQLLDGFFETLLWKFEENIPDVFIGALQKNTDYNLNFSAMQQGTDPYAVQLVDKLLMKPQCIYMVVIILNRLPVATQIFILSRDFIIAWAIQMSRNNAQIEDFNLVLHFLHGLGQHESDIGTTLLHGFLNALFEEKINCLPGSAVILNALIENVSSSEFPVVFNSLIAQYLPILAGKLPASRGVIDNILKILPGNSITHWMPQDVNLLETLYSHDVNLGVSFYNLNAGYYEMKKDIFKNTLLKMRANEHIKQSTLFAPPAYAPAPYVPSAPIIEMPRAYSGNTTEVTFIPPAVIEEAIAPPALGEATPEVPAGFYDTEVEINSNNNNNQAIDEVVQETATTSPVLHSGRGRSMSDLERENQRLKAANQELCNLLNHMGKEVQNYKQKADSCSNGYS